MLQLPSLAFGAADIVLVITLRTTAAASGTTMPTTDQAPEQVGMHTVIARGKLLILSQLGLNPFKNLLADQGRNMGNQLPQLWLRPARALATLAHRVQRRAARLGGLRVIQTSIHLTGIGRVPQNHPDRLRPPVGFASWRGQPLPMEFVG